jgi:multicomponent Na+:H+ antiporter subunit C
MYFLTCIAVGVLFACAFYLIMQRGLTRLLIGLSLLAPASNLYVLAVGGLTPHGVPVVSGAGPAAPPDIADPVPQALILTAIVIGLGIQIFFLVLLQQAYVVTASDDVDEWRESDS